jgi:hypothetical protein
MMRPRVGGYGAVNDRIRCDRHRHRTGRPFSDDTSRGLSTVVYQPDPIDAPSAGNVLICCSRPQSDIVIDL